MRRRAQKKKMPRKTSCENCQHCRKITLGDMEQWKRNYRRMASHEGPLEPTNEEAHVYLQVAEMPVCVAQALKKRKEK
jgi:hypothetical protein